MAEKKRPKTNFNVPTWEIAIAEFEEWAVKVAGHKGDKLAGGLRAIQALHAIDEDLATRLMQPDITAKEAEKLIISSQKCLPRRQEDLDEIADRLFRALLKREKRQQRPRRQT